MRVWNIWTAFPTVTLFFSELGTVKANLSQDAFEKIEQFVVFMYEKNSTATTVNAARQKVFSQRCKAFENISPTQNALRQHTLRATCQAFWGEPVSPQSTKVAISICRGMDQGRRITMKATMDNKHFARLRTRATS